MVTIIKSFKLSSQNLLPTQDISTVQLLFPVRASECSATLRSSVNVRSSVKCSMTCSALRLLVHDNFSDKYVRWTDDTSTHRRAINAAPPSKVICTVS
jgi:hypothetical protein